MPHPSLQKLDALEQLRSMSAVCTQHNELAQLREQLRREEAAADELRNKIRARSQSPLQTCRGSSDVTLGYVLARSNLSISLVSVRNAMRDETYGAMNAERFVVAHHLRTQQAFQAAGARAMAQPAWAPMLQPCAAWPAATLATTWAKDPSGGGDDPARLAQAMRSFGCCQAWRLCEVLPSGSG